MLQWDECLHCASQYVTEWVALLEHCSYQAHVTMQGHTSIELDAAEGNPLGPTLSQLASDDRAMHCLLLAYQMPLNPHRLIDAVD